jgi:hypothetical protein
VEAGVSWEADKNITPLSEDATALACVLEGQHGVHAAEVADFFSNYHAFKGDATRSWAWAGVAQIVRRRERTRLKAPRQA